MQGEAADLYVVVVNLEEQFSIWRSGSPPPSGWRSVTPDASKTHCIEYIESNWVDMRPLSVRRAFEAPDRRS